MKHRSRASFTADAACAARAHGSLHDDPKLRNPDTLARRIVGMPFRALLLPGVRRGFVGMFERRGPGVYFLHQARTHYLDALVRREIADGARQLVLLGAGFDTRAHRLVTSGSGARVFEVDHPLTSAEKQARVRRIFGARPDHVTYVAVDFEHETAQERLAASGYDPAQRTVVLWEGVSVYLDEAAVHAVLEFAARAAKGSVIAFDHVHARALAHPGPAMKKQMDLAASYGEPYRFGVDPEQIAGLLARHGMSVADALDSDALTARFLVGSDGAVWGRVTEGMALAVGRV